MPSSTSPSRFHLPKLALGLLGIAALSLAAAFIYTMRFNPEVLFWKDAFEIKKAWAAKISGEGRSKVVVFGGSSCVFSIDTRQIGRETGIPVVNAGSALMMGAPVLAQSAMSLTSHGDTLVVALEPGALAAPMTLKPLGMQFSVVTGHTEWLRQPKAGPRGCEWSDIIHLLRPGGRQLIWHAAKLGTGKPMYRYRLEDVEEGGLCRTNVRLPITGPAGHSGHLSEDARALLRDIREWCEANEVRVAYSLPWSFCPASELAAFQKKNAGFLLEVQEFMPVIKDSRLGAVSSLDWYADTVWHLNEEGVKHRSHSFGQALSSWSLWSKEELESLRR